MPAPERLDDELEELGSPAATPPGAGAGLGAALPVLDELELGMRLCSRPDGADQVEPPDGGAGAAVPLPPDVDPEEVPEELPDEPDPDELEPAEPRGMACPNARAGTTSPAATAKEVSARIDLVM